MELVTNFNTMYECCYGLTPTKKAEPAPAPPDERAYELQLQLVEHTEPVAEEFPVHLFPPTTYTL